MRHKNTVAKNQQSGTHSFRANGVILGQIHKLYFIHFIFIQIYEDKTITAYYKIYSTSMEFYNT